MEMKAVEIEENENPFELGDDLLRAVGKKMNTLHKAVIELKDFMVLPLPQKQNLLSPWLKEQTITLVSGWRGVGKSWFTMSVCNAVTSGESFGPWKVETPCPSLYLEGEMAAADIQDRFGSLTVEGKRKAPLYVYSDAWANNIGLRRANLLNRKWRSEMKDLLIDLGVKMWVADNIASLTPGIDENMKQPWDQVNQWLLDLRFSGISTILVHHVGKEGQQRGTSSREDNIDIAITLKSPPDYVPEDGARFIVKFTKTRLSTDDLAGIGDTEFKLQLGLNDSLVWTWRNVRKENKAKILEMLDQGIGQQDIAQGLGLSKGYVSRVKSVAIEEGLLSTKGKLTQTGFLHISQ